MSDLKKPTAYDVAATIAETLDELDLHAIGALFGDDELPPAAAWLRPPPAGPDTRNAAQAGGKR